MLDFFRRFYDRTFSRQSVAFTLLFGMICAVVGPLGTFTTMGFGERLYVWGVSCGLALILGGFLSEIVATVHPRATRIAHGAWIALGFSMVFPVLITWIGRAKILTANEPLLGYLETKFVIICFAIIFGLMLLLVGPKPEDAKLPRLYARLPKSGSARVCRLTVDDHYTKVYMNDGTCSRLLMRFADAVKEMDDADGFCTHRSHWVSLSYVVSATKRGTREFIDLHDGTQVPISKTYRQAVVDAGFLPSAPR
ncbi:MAG: LytTR family transcriptional regulator [Yoonia sp.]|nr:LytTR family transcriptional regulator [Yoonia sp.]